MNSALASSGSETPAVESVRPGEVLAKDRRYSTGSLVIMSGATERQLQWWDEKGIATAIHVGHRREYSFEQSLLAMICQHLRSGGISCQRVRALTMGIAGDSRVRDAIEDDSELFLLAGKNSRFAMSERMAIREMVCHAEAFLVIPLHEYIRTLKACTEPMARKKYYW